MASSINASTSGAGGVITTADNTGILQLQSASTTVATINAYGIGLGTGVPSSGIGITFPATQSASSDANTLDDYEEGTWTPNVYNSSSGTGASTWATKVGFYVKIGTLVQCWFMCDGGVSGTAGSQLAIAGLPFASSSSNPAYGTSGIYGCNDTATPNLTGNVNIGPSASAFNLSKGGQSYTVQQSFISGSFQYRA